MLKECQTRVMIVSHSLGTGGAEMMVCNLASSLYKSGRRVHVVSLCGADTDIGHILRGRGVPVSAMHKRKGLDPKVVLSLAKEIRHFKPTVIHTHLPVLEYVMPAVLLSGQRVRVVHTFHSTAQNETRRPSMRLFNRMAFKAGVVPVALSEEVRDSICVQYRLRAEKVPIVANGVDLDSFRAESSVSRPHAAIRLLCVARLADVKNHALLIEVVRELKERMRIPVSLTVVGDGYLRESLVEYALKLGVQDQVVFTGQAIDVARYYREADLFVLLSRYEGLPMSIIEAMAAGLPVVASEVGGIPSIVRTDFNGVLVGFDAFQTASVIRDLIREPERYKRLSRNASQTALRYSAERMMEGYVALYR